MRMRLPLVVLTLALAMGCGGVSPTTMEFVELVPAHPKLGEVVTVRFLLKDERGVPMSGQPVSFKLSSDINGIKEVEDVQLSPAVTSTNKGTGIAETQLQVNKRVTSVIVVATSGDKTVTSPPITFAGTVPNGRQFTFQCGQIAGDASGGRHAIGAYDQTRHLIAGVKLDCSAHVGDRNGDGVEGALVSFLVEAGAIGPTETSQTNVVGDATILYKTSYPLPKDVGPERFTWTPAVGTGQTGAYVAPLWMEPFSWVANPIQWPRPAPGANPQEPSRIDPIRRDLDGQQLRLNPRDNLVSMIAITSGEEGFTDIDNNGEYTDGEPFDDLTEPFVDSNDNGTWDNDERFIDVNGNGQWDPQNGHWDPNSLIWVQERLLWTGIPHALDAQSSQPIIRPIEPASGIVMTCPSCSSYCAKATPDYTVLSILSDPWYNTIAQNADDDGCQVPPVEESPIKTSPLIVNEGFKFTYPAGDVISFTIKDARDPQALPEEQIPPRCPGVPFNQPVVCKFTASPLGGHKVILEIGTVNGTIQ